MWFRRQNGVVDGGRCDCDDGLLGAADGIEQVATLRAPRCQCVIDGLRDPPGVGSKFLQPSQQLPTPSQVRGIQSAMLVAEMSGHLVVVVERVGPHIGPDRPRLDQRHGNAPWTQLHTECIGQGLDGVLRCAVGAGARCGEQTTDRGHEHHPPPSDAEFRENRLRHCDLRNDVDVELLCQIIERQSLDWPVDDDAGVVDDTVQLAGKLIG